MPQRVAWPKTTKRKLKAASGGRKLAEVVAEGIEAEIIRRDWPVGEVVGSETELIALFGVSRAVFREAIRVVENHGAAHMRRGPNGGLVVARPEPTAITRASALMLNYQGVNAEDLIEARMVIELAAVAEATTKLDESGIAQLTEVLELETDRDGFDAASRVERDIHTVIARLSENPALALCVSVLVEMTTSERGQAKANAASGRRRKEIALSVHHAHEAIVDAVIRGDAALAQLRMRRHLEAMKPWLL